MSDLVGNPVYLGKLISISFFKDRKTICVHTKTLELACVIFISIFRIVSLHKVFNMHMHYAMVFKGCKEDNS